MRKTSLALPAPVQFDIVFVTGLHKSGTSLLTERLSSLFFDTSRETNPDERGYGSAMPRYLTRECKIVRQINDYYRNLALASPLTSADQILGSPEKREEIRVYLEHWKKPIVIKAPFFGYSLEDWLDVVNKLELRPCVCLTQRDLSDIAAEWQKAPFTRSLMEQGEFERLHHAIQLQIGRARAAAIEVREFLYHDIVDFYPESELGLSTNAISAGSQLL